MIEKPVQFKIKGTCFMYRGKFDRLVDGVLTDWKSASDLAEFTDKKAVSFQLELYSMGAIVTYNRPVHKMQYCLVTRPGLKFCNKDKDAAAYEDRCYEWLIDPEYGRLDSYEFVVHTARFDSAKNWITAIAKRIKANRKSEDWLTNEHACYDFNQPCPYLDICGALSHGEEPDAIIDNQFEKRPCRHPELNDNNVNTLTYSSASCFAACEARYKLQVEESLQKAGYVEDSEPLYVGNVMHVGLAATCEGGLEKGLLAIDEWKSENPVLGADATHEQQQRIGKARAMTRAAAWKFLGYTHQ